MSFGTRLDYLRECDGISKKDLAYYLDVSPSTITGYTTDRRQPDHGMIRRIASYFGTTTDYLLGTTSIDSNGNNLSENENMLLEIYRSTNDEGRLFILKMAGGIWHLNKRQP